MKDLQKLAIILRAMGMRAKIEKETIEWGDGTAFDNIFLEVDRADCHWNIWHEGRLFEVHFFHKHECIYDQICHAAAFDTVKQICTDYDKYGK